jgi:hypothetical protein
MSTSSVGATGGRTVRVVRLYDPDGGVRLVDFEREAQDAQRALRDVERATDVKDRARPRGVGRSKGVVARAVSVGLGVEDVAAAAGVTVREVRAILRRVRELAGPCRPNGAASRRPGARLDVRAAAG